MGDLMEGERDPWHLDRRIPITLIAMAMGQIAVFGWFAATLTDGVESNQLAALRNGNAILRIESSVMDMREASNDHDVALGMINVTLVNLTNVIEKLDSKLEAIK